MKRHRYTFSKSDNTAILLVDYNKEVISDVQSFLMSEDKNILIQSMCCVYEAKKSDKKFSEDSEKQKLTLAFCDSSTGVDTLKKAVKEFNSTSDKFTIELKAYTYSENISADALLERDIVSGEIPDIVSSDLLSGNILTYLKDDSLTDMNQFIEKDNEISRDMFYSGVLDAFTYNNKLYSLPMIFTIDSVHLPGNTKMDNCSQIIDYITSTFSSDFYFDFGFDGYITESYLSENLDFANRKLNFSEMDLNKIISFIKNYSPELKGTDYDFPDEKRICDASYIASLRYYYLGQTNYKEINSETTGELGYSGMRGYIYPQMSFSIMENCENKDAAWEFIKTFCKTLGNNPAEELYSIKSLNICSEASSEIIERFDSFMEEKFIDSTLYNKLNEMILNEIYQNPDVSDEELSKAVYNKMELYFSEIQ